MPFLGYKKLAEIASTSDLPEGRPPLTEENVREAKEAGQVDLDDFASIVKYVAGVWGWLPPSEVGKMGKTIARLEDEVARLTLVNKQLDEALYKPMDVREAHVEAAEKSLTAARESLDAAMKRQGRVLSGQVVDNYKTPEDPYLARTKVLRYPGGSK